MSPATPTPVETLLSRISAEYEGLSRQLKVIARHVERRRDQLGLEGIQDLANDLQRLTPDSPFSEPLVAADGAYIIAIRTRIPSTIPPLKSIEPRVTEDYRRSLALEAARSAGQAFRNAVTNGIAAGPHATATCADGACGCSATAACTTPVFDDVIQVCQPA